MTCRLQVATNALTYTSDSVFLHHMIAQGLGQSYVLNFGEKKSRDSMTVQIKWKWVWKSLVKQCASLFAVACSRSCKFIIKYRQNNICLNAFSVCNVKYNVFNCFCSAMLCKHGLCRHAVSVCPSVCLSCSCIRSVETNGMV